MSAISAGIVITSSSVVSGRRVLVYDRVTMLFERVNETLVRAGDVSPEIMTAHEARVELLE